MTSSQSLWGNNPKYKMQTRFASLIKYKYFIFIIVLPEENISVSDEKYLLHECSALRLTQESNDIVLLCSLTLQAIFTPLWPSLAFGNH